MGPASARQGQLLRLGSQAGIGATQQHQMPPHGRVSINGHNDGPDARTNNSAARGGAADHITRTDYWSEYEVVYNAGRACVGNQGEIRGLIASIFMPFVERSRAGRGVGARIANRQQISNINDDTVFWIIVVHHQYKIVIPIIIEVKSELHFLKWINDHQPICRHGSIGNTTRSVVDHFDRSYSAI